MTSHPGSCLCGAVQFEVHGVFGSFYLCHCKYCQKNTGTAHAANLFSHSATIIWRSGEDAVASYTLKGTRHSKSFCQLCGSALPNTHHPGVLVVPAGSLDGEIPIRPTAHIFTSSNAWDRELGAIASFEGLLASEVSPLTHCQGVAGSTSHDDTALRNAKVSSSARLPSGVPRGM